MQLQQTSLLPTKTKIITLKLYLYIPAILPLCYIIVIIAKVGQFL